MKSTSSASTITVASSKLAIGNDPGIICFRHCASQIFATKILPKCPECDRSICSDDTMQLMPFRLPYPFTKPHENPCSIILRPTHGDFLNDFYNSMDLHIGVTTSRGTVVEFDKRGLSVSNAATEWNQSLIVDTVPEPWYDHWDSILDGMSTRDGGKWTADHYQEDDYNCYAFVLDFLARLGYGTLSSMAQHRNKFCEHYIIPRTTAAGKYISLYRKIRDQGYYIHSM